MTLGIGSDILITEEFARPIWFNPDLINAIASKNRVRFENILKLYNIKDTHGVRDCRGCSLLHVAAERDSAEIAIYLITSLGFEINLKNEQNGQTALMIAVKKQHFATAKALLKLNADISPCNIFGMNVLQMAIDSDARMTCNLEYFLEWHTEYWQIVGLILDKIDEKFSSDSEKIANYLLKMNCPLTHVVFMKNCKVMKIMIEKGSPINTTDRYSNRTALHLAVQYWKLDAVKILLDCKADFNIVDYYRTTPVMCIYNNVKYLQMMPPCEVELVKALLRYRRKLSGRGVEGFCLVDEMYPIFRHGSADAIRVAIMEHDDDLFLARNKDKFTLLHVIVENLNPGIAEVIKGKKINVNGTTRYGETALGHALEHGNCNMVEYLLSEGAITDVESATDYPARRSFLILAHLEGVAVFKRKLECVKVMLEYGMDQEILFRSRGYIMYALTSAFPEDIFPDDFTDLAEPVLAQLAIRDSLEVSIPAVILKLIEKHDKAKTYFYSRVQELQQTKTSVMFGLISVFEFLTASDQTLSVYARDRRLVFNLAKIVADLKLHPYYMELLLKRSSKISKMAESREKAEKIICQNIGVLYEYNAIVTSLIVNYLDDDDIKRLL